MTVVVQKASDNEASIQLSPSAQKHILSYLSKNPENKGVRFSVKKTGCSGLSYVIDYVTEAQSTDVVQALTEDYALYVDKQSFPFLKGMTIDYVQEGLNFKFIFNNPNQTGQCGCGESFTVD